MTETRLTSTDETRDEGTERLRLSECRSIASLEKSVACSHQPPTSLSSLEMEIPAVSSLGHSCYVLIFILVEETQTWRLIRPEDVSCEIEVITNRDLDDAGDSGQS